jgi:hypothetical protein
MKLTPVMIRVAAQSPFMQYLERDYCPFLIGYFEDQGYEVHDLQLSRRGLTFTLQGSDQKTHQAQLKFQPENPRSSMPHTNSLWTAIVDGKKLSQLWVEDDPEEKGWSIVEIFEPNLWAKRPDRTSAHRQSNSAEAHIQAEKATVIQEVRDLIAPYNQNTTQPPITSWWIDHENHNPLQVLVLSVQGITPAQYRAFFTDLKSLYAQWVQRYHLKELKNTPHNPRSQTVKQSLWIAFNF